MKVIKGGGKNGLAIEALLNGGASLVTLKKVCKLPQSVNLSRKVHCIFLKNDDYILKSNINCLHHSGWTMISQHQQDQGLSRSIHRTGMDSWGCRR